MPTFISPQFGKAALVRGATALLIDMDHEIPTIKASVGELQSFFRAASDLREITFSAEAKIRQVLQVEYAKDRALSLALISIDAELSQKTRLETIPLVDELLASSDVLNFVSNMLHALPIPQDSLSLADSIEGTSNNGVESRPVRISSLPR